MADEGALYVVRTLTLQLQVLCEQLEKIADRHPEIAPEIDAALEIMNQVGERRKNARIAAITEAQS